MKMEIGDDKMAEKSPMDAMKGHENFADFMKFMAEYMVLDIANDVKFGRMKEDDEMVKSILLICLQSHSFAMLKALNFAWNGSGDEEGFGAINEYIDKLQSYYHEGENIRLREVAG